MSETFEASDRPSGTPERVKNRFPLIQRLAIYFGMLVIVFLLGFLPMWLKARESAKERDTAQRELRQSRMENSLAAAAVDARRAEYESARQSASDFFSSLDNATQRKEGVAPAQAQAFERLLASRDEVITRLARNDPAAADLLTELYVSYRNSMRGPTAAASPAAAR